MKTLFDRDEGRTGPAFDGPEYQAHYDNKRLTSQLDRVRNLMLDGAWRTLPEIHAKTGDPAASISAQLRHLRKMRFGSYLVDRRARGSREHGLFEYRIRVAEVTEGYSKPPSVAERLKSAEAEVARLQDENDLLKAQIEVLRDAT